ncbi:MAG: MotA/TolQ/Exb proton channel [Thermoprotei archaeon]|nr:MAG: MotA/TolQ/Exb proton channel [Thermoprotei archaeon]
MKSFIISILMIVFCFASVFAEDARLISIEAEKIRASVLKKAELEEKQAKKEAEISRKKILSDKNALTASLNDLKSEINDLKLKNKRLEKENKKLAEKKARLAVEYNSKDAMAKELTGFIRIAAKDIDALLGRSINSAFNPDREKKIKPVLNKSRFPGMDDIKSMVEILFDEISVAGQVRLIDGPMINRAGRETVSKILTLGNFTAAYQADENGKNETGFLLFSPQSKSLFALSKLPPSFLSKKIKKYMAGKSADVPIDISHGAALRQITHRTSLKSQIQNGGPIVWPILGIGLFAVIIIIERLLFLYRANINADKMMNKINSLAQAGQWDEGINICEKQKKRPVPRVLLAGINSRNRTREEMENILQETILREIPRLEKFLSTLGIMAAIAPLLGLLGTVTGMINTFHVITFYGTGDPKMMSGGISEALTTTMLGLGVAIPIMLFHTFLSRNVETIISQMEEKGVALANIVFKGRTD